MPTGGRSYSQIVTEASASVAGLDASPQLAQRAYDEFYRVWHDYGDKIQADADERTLRFALGDAAQAAFQALRQFLAQPDLEFDEDGIAMTVHGAGVGALLFADSYGPTSEETQDLVWAAVGVAWQRGLQPQSEGGNGRTDPTFDDQDIRQLIGMLRYTVEG